MNWLSLLELWTGRIGAVVGFVTLGFVLAGFWRQRARPVGHESGYSARFLRWPFLFMATAIYIGLCILLWHPLPLELSGPARLIMLVVGSLIFFPALGLYLWGLSTLGEMFSASSGFGVRLYAGHRLITTGPFAYVRHPMYLAVILAGIGAFLLYKTWAMAFFAANMFFLAVRARREEQALAAEFWQEWTVYSQNVPAWIPRIRLRKTCHGELGEGRSEEGHGQ
jgi:isoprenylcysteine carboxyl methyltransferase (ICMT) family protein YpbQ